jgi:hypothetical protein
VFKRKSRVLERTTECIQFGTPGASAEAEYQRRLAALEAWRVGAEGERSLARELSSCAGICVLHDRGIPGRRFNIDHIAVAPSGIYVIDTKAWLARISPTHRRLLINGRERPDLLASLRRQIEAFEDRLYWTGNDEWPPITPVLCFIGAQWDMPPRWVGPTLVTDPDYLCYALGRPGPLNDFRIEGWAFRAGRAAKPRC